MAWHLNTWCSIFLLLQEVLRATHGPRLFENTTYASQSEGSSVYWAIWWPSQAYLNWANYVVFKLLSTSCILHGKKPKLETSPSLTVRGMIERCGGKSQQPHSTFHFKQDLIIMIDIRKGYFSPNFIRKRYECFLKFVLKSNTGGFLIGVLKLY